MIPSRAMGRNGCLGPWIACALGLLEIGCESAPKRPSSYQEIVDAFDPTAVVNPETARKSFQTYGPQILAWLSTPSPTLPSDPSPHQSLACQTGKIDVFVETQDIAYPKETDQYAECCYSRRFLREDNERSCFWSGIVSRYWFGADDGCASIVLDYTCDPSTVVGTTIPPADHLDFLQCNSSMSKKYGFDTGGGTLIVWAPQPRGDSTWLLITGTNGSFECIQSTDGTGTCTQHGESFAF